MGEGEDIWQIMLRDAAAGKLKKFYQADNLHSLAHLALPRYELIEPKHYGRFKTFSVQSSRGCPFKCEFCSERLYLGHKCRFRPIQDVIVDIDDMGRWPGEKCYIKPKNFSPQILEKRGGR